MPTPPIDFSGLSAEERLDLIGALWDSLDPQQLPPPSPDELAELERRVAEVRADPTAGRSWEAVKQDLDQRLK
jgi:putative addiction module component (TIGR02574 family)